MKRALPLLFILVLCSVNSFSQGENDNWYFHNSGVNFSDVTIPVAITNSAMTQTEGVASISDLNGNLLFYTNGRNIWDRNNVVMPNGASLLSHESAEQGVVIVPFPGISNRYYVFTAYATSNLTPNPTHNPYNYSIVNMELNNGNGDVEPGQKNIPLNNPSGTPLLQNGFSHEAMTYTVNYQNNGYWLLIPVTHPTNKLYSYQIDATGLVNNPVSSDIHFPINLSMLTNANQTAIKVNRRRNRIIIAKNYSNNHLFFYPFDNDTGLIPPTGLPNPYIGICSNCNAYVPEFNGDLLYFGSFTTGFNVIDTNLGTIRQIIPGSYEAGFQVGKTDEIYAAKYNFNYLLRVTNPNSFALSNIVTDTFLGVGHLSQLGLPQYNHILDPAICLPNRVLSNYTDYNFVWYSAATDIFTQSNYTVIGPTANVELIAGNAVLMRDTYIKSDSKFLAKILPCSLSRNTLVKHEMPSKSFVVNAISDENTIAGLEIYPNPVTNGTLFINTTANAEKNIAIFNVLGKEVFNTTTANNAVNVASLNSGVYILKITEAGKTATSKLVVR